MYWLFKEIPDISMSVVRYSLAWITAFEHSRNDFDSSYFTAAKTALAAATERPLSVVDSMHLYRRKLELSALTVVPEKQLPPSIVGFGTSVPTYQSRLLR